jgi:acyl carrier protein
MSSIRDRLLDFIDEKHGRRPADDEILLAGGVFDSLGYVLFVAFIENEFDIDIPAGDLNEANFRDLGSVLAYLNGRLAKNEAA